MGLVGRLGGSPSRGSLRRGRGLFAGSAMQQRVLVPSSQQSSRGRACALFNVIQNPVARRLAAGYDPCKPGRYRDRFFQKYNRERTMPIKWRSLEET